MLRAYAANLLKRILFLFGVVALVIVGFVAFGVFFFFGGALVLFPFAQLVCSAGLDSDLGCFTTAGLIIAYSIGTVLAVFVFNYYSFRTPTLVNRIKNTLELVAMVALFLLPIVALNHTQLVGMYTEALSSSPPRLETFERQREEAIAENAADLPRWRLLLRAAQDYEAGKLDESGFRAVYRQSGDTFADQVVITKENNPDRINNLESLVKFAGAFDPPSAQSKYEQALAAYNAELAFYTSRGRPTIGGAIQRTLGFKGW